MNEERGTVLVIDDDSSVRESLSLLLTSAGYGVKAYASAEEFLASECDWPGPACLILDLKMPGLGGLDLQKELGLREYAMPIIFITGHGDIPASVRAMKKGAVNFLPKPFDARELLDALQEALQKDAQTRSVRNEREQILRRLDSLTPREHEILTHLITGRLNKQIAHALNIAERTVKAHRRQVMEKMGVDSVAELVRLTEKVGVNPADDSF